MLDGGIGDPGRGQGAVRQPMRASRAIQVCLGAAVSVLLASVWIGSSSERDTFIGPQVVEDAPGSQRESAVLTPATVFDSSTRMLPDAPRIRGRLVDKVTGKPIAGWTVKLECPSEPENIAAAFGAVDEPAVANLFSSRIGARDHGLVLQRLVHGLNDVATAPTPDGTQVPLLGALPIVQEPEKPAESTVFLPRIEISLGPMPVDGTPAIDPAQLPPYPESSTPSAPEPVPAEPAAPEPEVAAPQGNTPEGTFTLSANVVLSYQVQAGEVTSLTNVAFQRALTDSLRTRIVFAEPQIFLTDLRVGNEMTRQAMFSLFAQRGLRHSIRFRPALPTARHDQCLGECVTDAEGWFEFACPDRDDAWLAIDPQEPLYPDQPNWDLGPSERACGTTIEWKVRLVERAIVRGRVIDELTGEPVPYLTVEIADPDYSESCTTDADGRFTSVQGLETGRVRAEFRDGPKQHAVKCADPSALHATGDGGMSAAEIEFRVTIGPTFRFTWNEAATPPEMFVRIRGLVPVDRDVNPMDDAWQTLRTEDGWFWRSPVPLIGIAEQTPFAELCASDSLRRAQVALLHLAGRGEPIVTEFTLGARLSGHVVDAEGTAILGARISVLDARGGTIDSVESDGDGAWTILGLDPRAVSRVIVAHDGRVLTRIVPLGSGDERELDVTFDSSPTEPAPLEPAPK